MRKYALCLDDLSLDITHMGLWFAERLHGLFFNLIYVSFCFFFILKKNENIIFRIYIFENQNLTIVVS